MSPRIALVGPGAIGSTVAALLHAAGHRVTLCGTTQRDSIELRPDPGTGVKGPIVVPGPVLTDPRSVAEPVDIVLLGVKDTQNAAAAPWLAKLCDPRTVVIAMQNGVEQVERVGRLCPDSAVVPVVMWFTAERLEQGWVRLWTEARMVLPDDKYARAVGATLSVPGMTIELDPDFITEQWRKLLTNAVTGLMALTGRRSGMFRRADVAHLARRYMAECLAVARAEGAALDDRVIDELIDTLTSSPDDMGTSILYDRQAGRPLEWDIRNGVILRKAAKHGLPAPLSEILVPLLAAASDGPG